MPIGPRLDAPSGVGDEGRPRETSLWIVAAVVVVLALVTGAELGTARYFGSYALFAGTTVAGIALIQRDRLGQAVVGHVLFLPGGALLVGLALTAAENAGVHWALVVGYVVALFGVAAGWADVFDDGSLTTAGKRSLTSFAFALVEVVVLVIVVAVAGAGLNVLDGLSSAEPTGALLAWFVLVAGVAGVVSVAVGAVPVVEATPVHRRPAVARRVTRVRRTLRTVALGALTLAVAGAVLGATGALDSFVDSGAGTALVDVLTSVVVFGPLVVVTAVASLAAAVAVGLRKVTGARDGTSTQTVAAAIAAAAYIVAAASFAVTAARVDPDAGDAIVGMAIILPVAVYLCLFAVIVVIRIGMIPDRAGAPAVAAAGLILAALGAAETGLPAVLVFATVAGGLVAWDLGTYGLGITAELGHLPETRRLELYHGVFAVGVGLVGVAAATVLDAARRSVATGVWAPEAMSLAVVGLVLLAIPLRG